MRRVQQRIGIYYYVYEYTGVDKRTAADELHSTRASLISSFVSFFIPPSSFAIRLEGHVLYLVHTIYALLHPYKTFFHAIVFRRSPYSPYTVLTYIRPPRLLYYISCTEKTGFNFNDYFSRYDDCHRYCI